METHSLHSTPALTEHRAHAHALLEKPFRWLERLRGMGMSDAWLARVTFRLLSKLEHGKLTLTTPRGRQFVFRGLHGGVETDIVIKDWSTVREVLLRGDIGFCEAYMDGRWETSDLPLLFTFFLQNHQALGLFYDGAQWQRVWFMVQNRILRRNSRSGSRANIMAHYDLGNNFYQLWLDRTMTYSSALYEGDMTRSLEEAQRAKYQRMLKQLGSSAATGTILEIGCGWGGLAEEALRAGQSVIGLTLSPAQRAYALQRLEGLQTDTSKAEIRLQDYRDIDGQYDGIISIEMFEAVGEKYWGQYFSTVASRLKPGARAVIQAITIRDEYFNRYRNSGDFIRQYVFPGGMLISPSRFVQEAERAGMRVVDSFSMGQDYARTLNEWLIQFDAMETEVRHLGFDDAFLRLWRLYLAMCIASFTVGRTNVYQYTLEHAAS